MSRIWMVAAIGLLATWLFAQTSHYNLGRAASPEETRARDISVRPDGTGLPPGRGTAKIGRLVYEAQCAGCHGPDGRGDRDYRALVGGQGTLATDHPLRTVGSYWPYATTVWDYINRAMPYRTPGNLKPNEVYSVTAYLLYLNGIIEENQELNQETLPKVRMPNRDGFVPDPRPDVKAEH